MKRNHQRDKADGELAPTQVPVIGGREVVEADIDHCEYQDDEAEEDEHELHPVVHGDLHQRALERSPLGCVAAEPRLVSSVDN